MATLYGNNVNSTWNFSFVYGSANYIQVTYTDTNGIATILTPSQYTLFLNPPAVGSIWGIGGNVTFPTSGPPIPNGASITIARVLPLTQTTSITNQGDFYPTVVETALDVQCLETQQVSGRTGQIRGVWATGIQYNYSDYVTDGINGNNTQNIYMCAIANTSGAWNTDLANGDWVIALNVQAIISGGTGNMSTVVYDPAAINQQLLGITAIQNVSNKTLDNTNIITVKDANFTIQDDADVTKQVKFQANALATATTRTLGVQDVNGTLYVTGGSDVAIADGGTGISTSFGYGQCRLSKSGANLLLSPYQGNKININGAYFLIPSAGITLAPTGAVASTLYYIYIFNNTGTLTLEFSTTGHSTDTTTGVEIKTGDSTRTLVGMAFASATNTWGSGGADFANWFNRRPITNFGFFSVNRSTTSLTLVEINTEIRTPYCTWGDWVETKYVGTASHSVVNGVISTYLVPDATGVAIASTNITGNIVNSTQNHNTSVPVQLPEGYHFITLYGSVGTAGTATWFSNSSFVTNGRIYVTIWI